MPGEEGVPTEQDDAQQQLGDAGKPHRSWRDWFGFGDRNKDAAQQAPSSTQSAAAEQH
jgi:hypothetical protein